MFWTDGLPRSMSISTKGNKIRTSEGNYSWLPGGSATAALAVAFEATDADARCSGDTSLIIIETFCQ